MRTECFRFTRSEVLDDPSEAEYAVAITYSARVLDGSSPGKLRPPVQLPALRCFIVGDGLAFPIPLNRSRCRTDPFSTRKS